MHIAHPNNWKPLALNAHLKIHPNNLKPMAYNNYYGYYLYTLRHINVNPGTDKILSHPNYVLNCLRIVVLSGRELSGCAI